MAEGLGPSMEQRYYEFADWLNEEDYAGLTVKDQVEKYVGPEGSRGYYWVESAWRRGVGDGLHMAAISAEPKPDVSEEAADMFFRGFSAGIAMSIIAAALLTVLL